jgi:hypothetical protein
MNSDRSLGRLGGTWLNTIKIEFSTIRCINNGLISGQCNYTKSVYSGPVGWLVSLERKMPLTVLLDLQPAAEPILLH